MVGTECRGIFGKGGSGGRGGSGGSLSLDDNEEGNDEDVAGYDDGEESEVTGAVAALPGAGGVCSGGEGDASLFP